MENTLIEIKAKVPDQKRIRMFLKSHNADFKGVDFQTDIYFKVPRGRLKIRHGNIENRLVYYERENGEYPKKSDVILVDSPSEDLEKLLRVSLGVLVQVHKKREIYFINNVKFHVDDVSGLGKFVEIEAIGKSHETDRLRQQCEHYMSLLGIRSDSLIKDSYSDMLLRE